MDSRDKLTIDTPEQVALEFPLAGIGSRFLALVFDILVQFIVYVVLFLLSLWLLGGLWRSWAPAWNWSTALLILVLFCIYWGYYAFFETVWKGQTPGKRYAQIRVIKEDGRPVTVFEAIARNLVRIIDNLPGMYAVGVITMFLNRKNKRLGDFVAGTVVIHERKEEEPLWNLPQNAQVPVYRASELKLQEIELIETFLARRLDLTAEVRRATAERIATRIAERLNVQDQPRSDNEDFLEAVVREFRDTARFR